MKNSESIGKGAVWLPFILPALLIYSVFMAFPLLDSIRLSFMGAGGAGKAAFVGLANYRRLFTDPAHAERFGGAFLNTWYFFFIHMAVQNVLGILFATMLSGRGLRFSGLYRTIIFIPATLAVLVSGYLWKLILNPQWGALALSLQALGLGSLVKPWLGDPAFALTAVSLVSAWQWVGLPTMMFLAGLQNISDDIYEAARIDGAGRVQTFFGITLPLLMPIVGIVAILTFVGNFNAFDVVFAMENVNGAPLYATDLMGTFFYRVGIAGQHPVSIPDPGLGAAVATITFILLAVGTVIIMGLTRSSPRRDGR